MIRAAQDAIGEGDSDNDWKIVPTEHAQMFEGKADSLAQTLRGERPNGLAEMYERLNDRAIKARDSFKSTVSKADTAVFCTAGLAALLLVAGGFQGSLDNAGAWVVESFRILGDFSAGAWVVESIGILGDISAGRWVVGSIGILGAI